VCSFNLSEECDALRVKCAGSVADVHQLRCSFEEQNEGWSMVLPFCYLLPLPLPSIFKQPT